MPFFLLNGAVFVALLFTTEHWKRLVPSSWQILPDAWNVFVHDATFNMPVEPNGFYHYNALQQLACFTVVFILPPLSMLSGMAMSPAIENRFHWFPKIFGNRQGARSVHFLVMAGYLLFLAVHVAMVAATGLSRNLNHITMGTDDPASAIGLYLAVLILFLLIITCISAHWLSWRRPRRLQYAEAWLNGNLWRFTINKFKPRKHFTRQDISPFFWPYGKLPVSEEWKTLAAGNLEHYRLKIGGLVKIL